LPEKKAILIVEDTAEIAELIRDLLNAEPDYQAAVARDASEAIELLRAVQTDLILLDVGLPGMDGFQLYDLLQDDPATKHIPIVFVTATTNAAAIKERKAHKYVAKPFNLDHLMETVAEVLRPR
jgi:CheY-like chemotaxis protein